MDRVDRILAQWQRERPDLDVTAMGLIGRIRRLSLHLLRGMEETFAAHGLTAAAFDVLATLRRSGPPYSLSPGELIATTMVTSGTMTHRIAQLEKAGLVERVVNPEDRRGAIISLTKQGFALIDAAVTAHVETQARLTAALSKGEKAALAALLRKYLAAFETEP
ncbi:transcriptional regulator, MarR family [Tistlia consotensis]|uniref:DNA-binding transcriptional regulator, MarR family n=1 Tax=Tistlia consotensis USBA 355 TaxID=560819 RepID=A0A1Y6C227_9PROT|nr:MarR family transcriptional regulator [Tistlia consotensis]SMF41215.1 DNA-binding transcriptional regulator, MarR family [Tistlia consotensis USBA 355]SNR73908.1 transcriptional regulator, MarR family [Tistlia consotensis]